MFFVIVFLCVLLFGFGVIFYFKFAFNVFEISEEIKSAKNDVAAFNTFKGKGWLALVSSPLFIFSVLQSSNETAGINLLRLTREAKKNYWRSIVFFFIGTSVSIATSFYNSLSG
jgi:hypothetical protein